MTVLLIAVYLVITAFLGLLSWACFRGAVMMSRGRQGVQALLSVGGTATGMVSVGLASIGVHWALQTLTRGP